MNLRVFLLLGSLAIIARAQRPLNTTTNGTSVLTEPFFVKPTSILSKQQYPEQRGGGGSYYSNVHDSPGIRNKERTPPQHPNSHLDIFVPPLNVVGGQQSAQPAPAPNNRLHKVQKSRQNKFSMIREMIRNSSSTNGIDHVIGKKVSQPERQVATGPIDESKIESRPSSKGEAIQKIKDMQRVQNNQHTPSPPSYNVDDVDFDEKLGVKCSFEKQCAWTFDTNVTGPNFEVTTGVNLKDSNITGLLFDLYS